MKYFAFLFCAMLSLGLAQPAIPVASVVDGPIQTISNPAQSTLAQDLKELKSLMQLKDIKSLINLYLLKDAEFQGIIRVLNSHEAYIAFMKLKTQPETMAFRRWMQDELRRSGGNGSSAEGSGDLEIINHCGNSVYGWQGFITEFNILYPEYTVRQHIQLKQQQGGSFAEFWQHLRGLSVVFDRFLLFPETQNIVALLQEQNVDVLQLENFIRTQLDWIVVAPGAPVANGEPTPTAQ